MASSSLFVTLRRKFEKLVFRRVKSVLPPTGLIEITHATFVVDGEDGPRESITYYRPGHTTLPDWTADQVHRGVSEYFEKFTFFTSGSKLRENDTHDRLPIKGSSDYRVSLSWKSPGEPEFTIPTTRLPLPRATPGKEELICGFVKKDKAGKLVYSSWFIASEQFLHFWTLVMFGDSHVSFTRNRAQENVRRYLMSGNRLCTNTFRKYRLSCEANGLPLVGTETGYHQVRSEGLSKDWVHAYAALALVGYYGEAPNETNIPNNLDSSPKMKAWDLPSGWLEYLSTLVGVTPSLEELAGSEGPSTLIDVSITPSGLEYTTRTDPGVPRLATSMPMPDYHEKREHQKAGVQKTIRVLSLPRNIPIRPNTPVNLVGMDQFPLLGSTPPENPPN